VEYQYEHNTDAALVLYRARPLLPLVSMVEADAAISPCIGNRVVVLLVAFRVKF
jgi:hypothetical protein